MYFFEPHPNGFAIGAKYFFERGHVRRAPGGRQQRVVGKLSRLYVSRAGQSGGTSTVSAKRARGEAHGAQDSAHQLPRLRHARRLEAQRSESFHGPHRGGRVRRTMANRIDGDALQCVKCPIDVHCETKSADSLNSSARRPCIGTK